MQDPKDSGCWTAQVLLFPYNPHSFALLSLKKSDCYTTIKYAILIRFYPQILLKTLNEFLRAVRNREPAPLGVYDAVAMCVINPLSGESITNGSRPVKCPDFTGGKWENNELKFATDVDR